MYFLYKFFLLKQSLQKETLIGKLIKETNNRIKLKEDQIKIKLSIIS